MKDGRGFLYFSGAMSKVQIKRKGDYRDAIFGRITCRLRNNCQSQTDTGLSGTGFNAAHFNSNHHHRLVNESQDNRRVIAALELPDALFSRIREYPHPACDRE
jgi:hypothetical protein